MTCERSLKQVLTGLVLLVIEWVSKTEEREREREREREFVYPFPIFVWMDRHEHGPMSFKVISDSVRSVGEKP
jgi:hypothetical protein